MTLGCGTWGGSITADNVTPMHLLNIKRLAYETRPLNPGKTRITPSEANVRWRYDDQYRYRPESEAGNTVPASQQFPAPQPGSKEYAQKPASSGVTPETTYGEGITEAQVDKIIREFRARN